MSDRPTHNLGVLVQANGDAVENPQELEDQRLGRKELGGVGDLVKTPRSWKTRGLVDRILVMTPRAWKTSKAFVVWSLVELETGSQPPTAGGPEPW